MFIYYSYYYYFIIINCKYIIIVITLFDVFLRDHCTCKLNFTRLLQVMTSNAYPQTKLIGPKASVAILIYEFSFSELIKDLSGILVRASALNVGDLNPS